MLTLGLSLVVSGVRIDEIVKTLQGTLSKFEEMSAEEVMNLIDQQAFGIIHEWLDKNGGKIIKIEELVNIKL